MWRDRPILGSALPDRTLCLTFDDGPGPLTVELAHYLAAENIPATFFVVGKEVERRPDVLAQVAAAGHSIGNHTHSHPHLTSSHLAASEIVSEVSRGNLGATGKKVFRPPYGAWSPRVAHLLRFAIPNANIGPVLWDFGGFDLEFWTEAKSAQKCAEAYLRQVTSSQRKKGIMLMHDHAADFLLPRENNQSLQLLQLLVPKLRSQGFRFAPLGEVPEIKREIIPGAGPSTS